MTSTHSDAKSVTRTWSLGVLLAGMCSTASIVQLWAPNRLPTRLKPDVLLKRSHPWKIYQIPSATTPLQIGWRCSSEGLLTPAEAIRVASSAVWGALKIHEVWGSCIGLTHFSTHTPGTSEPTPTRTAVAWQQARLKTITLAYYRRTFTAADWFCVGGWTLERLRWIWCVCVYCHFKPVCSFVPRP